MVPPEWKVLSTHGPLQMEHGSLDGFLPTVPSVWMCRKHNYLGDPKMYPKGDHFLEEKETLRFFVNHCS